MPSGNENRNGSPSRVPAILLRGAPAFAVSLGLLVFAVDSTLLFRADKWFPVFSVRPSFVWTSLRVPGGLCGYAAAFLSQLLAWPVAGAVAAALPVAACAEAMAAAAKRIAGVTTPAVPAATAALALLAFAAYGNPLPALTGLAATLACVLLYLWAGNRPAAVRGALAVIGTVLTYVAAGGFAILFALAVAAFEYRRDRRSRVGAAAFAAGFAVPAILGCGVSGLGWGAAFSAALPWAAGSATRGRLPAALLVVLPCLAAAILILRASRGGAGPAPAASGSRRHRLLQRLTRADLPTAAVAFVLVIAAVCVGLDRHARDGLRVAAAARNGDWERVLDLAGRTPLSRYSLGTACQANKALYYTGMLPDRMFAYPQTPMAVTFSVGYDAAIPGEILNLRADLFFENPDINMDLGLVAEAEHEAHEALAVYGPHPAILSRLARVNVVKQRPGAAAIFLNALAENPFERKAARARLASLAADPSGLGDEEAVRIRRRMHRTDPPFRGLPFAERCDKLLEADPGNRMAFEFMMANALAERDVEGVVANLRRLRDLGYERVPRHYREAMLLYEALSGKRAAGTSLPFDSAIDRKYAEFSTRLGELTRTGSTNSAADILRPEFGDSYFYYFAFGTSGNNPR